MTGKKHDEIAALAELFMSAPLEADGWDTALKALARATHSSRTNLVEISPGSFVYNWVTDTPSRYHEASDEIGAGDSTINWRIASIRAPLQVSHEHHYREAKNNMKSTLYTDYSEMVDSPFGCQMVLSQSATSFEGLAVLRSHGDGETTEDNRAVFAAAAPHVRTALQMQRAIERQGAALAAGALAAMKAAAFICDAYGAVIALTEAAEESLREQSGLRLSESRLSARHPHDDRRLQRALADILMSEKPPEHPISVWVRTGPGPLSGQICEIYSLPVREWALGWQARALVVVRTPDLLNNTRHLFLREMFDLTMAEAEIAGLMGEGLSREEIAARRGASPATVNSQLKNIFGKMDVTREAELVALVNKILR